MGRYVFLLPEDGAYIIYQAASGQVVFDTFLSLVLILIV